MVQDRLNDGATPDAGDGAPGAISSDELPFFVGAPAKGADPDDVTSGSSSRPASFFSSREGSPGASGSALVDQVLGAAKLMGHDVEVPALPYDSIAAQDPLRDAILTWVAITGADVDPQELAAELARADALPVDLQRDLALLVLSATKAHLLQLEALAQLTPAQQAWVRANPEVAQDLAAGIVTAETEYMAALAGLVDMGRSIEASLLMLQAVEATRGTLSHAAAQAALEQAAATPLDATTRDLLAYLVSDPGMMSDQDKVRYAARLVSMTSGVPLPERPADITFPDAVARLLAATGQTAAPDGLAAALERADALPLDLQRALAGVIAAQAAAVEVAHPDRATPHTQTQAMLGVLLASADAMPVLQKYGLFWSQAPAALRIGQWDPATRAGWAAEHAGLFLSTKGDLADMVRAGAYLHGFAIPMATPLPQRTLPEAVAAYAAEGGMTLDATQLAELEKGAKAVSPAVAEAGALLITGATESWRLDKLAYAQLTPAERDELMRLSVGLDELYAKERLTPEETARLERVVDLSSLVDGSALARSQLVAVEATTRAREILTSYQVQGEATVVETGFRALLQRLLPFGTARAQTEAACGDRTGGVVIPDDDMQDGQWFMRSAFGLSITTDCSHDVLLRVTDPLLLTGPFFTGGEAQCDVDECWTVPIPHDPQLLVISGTGSGIHMPVRMTRTVYANGCGTASSQNFSCIFTPATGFQGRVIRQEVIPTYGAPRIHLDLGGSDTYQRGVAMTFPNMTAPVSIHLDLGGNDIYADPSPLYDPRDGFRRWVGDEFGHPTQGSALWGGVALLVDAQGVDSYEARTRSQGFGRYGLGALLDLAGQDDTYDARGYSMGASSDTLNLGLGVLVDAGGADKYRGASGGGYGLGGVLFDAAGRDTYTMERDPYGLPVVHLDVLPGGDLTTLDQRGDNRIWLDGPEALNVGFGLDAELATISNTDSDSDSWSDLAEFLAGSDPNDGTSGVDDGPNDRVQAILVDTDQDLYPDFVENALSSDPEDRASYPAGFPTGPTFWIPTGVALVDQVTRPDEGGLTPTETVAPPAAKGSDKILDIQIPVQDAGSIDKACARQYLNVSNPGSGSILGGFASIITTNKSLSPIDGGTDAVDEDAQRNDPQGLCVVASLTSGEGGGNLTVPKGAGPGPITPGQTGAVDQGHDFTFRLPTGILAIGDLVDTNYTADYFVAIDLGGDDVFHRNAGGALLVALKPTNQGNPLTREITFAAPSVVLNVDLSKVTGNRSEAKANNTPASLDTRNVGDDRYVNATVDATQGAFFGVLIDNVGSDTYTAGNLSQGSVGGLLLDLGGHDAYTAGGVSQGAAIGGGRSGGPGHPGYPNNARPTTSDQGVRGNVPGLLLDLGTGDDRYTSGAYSQGFARSFYVPAAQAASASDGTFTNAGPRALALLFDQGGNDTYAATEKATGTQAVAGYGGTALLVDLSGSDKYAAHGLLSQAATLSLTHGTYDNTTSDRPDPAVAVLMDLGGADEYRVTGVGPVPYERRERSENFTITRQETTTPGGAASARQRDQSVNLFLEVAMHLDATADQNDPAKLLVGVGGAGSGGKALGTSTSGDFLVNLPTARLAIGGAGNTIYDREYAVVIDLGGSNTYRYNAGGFVRDIVARTGDSAGLTPNGGGRGAEQTLTSGERSRVTLFPVSLLVDVGDAQASTYRFDHGLAQGAGLFGVGVLVDMGGDDRFTVARQPIPSLTSAWLPAPPVVDGTVGSTEWAGVEPVTLDARDLRDTRFTTPITVRIANDDRDIYFSIQGKTESGAEFTFDQLVIDLNQGRRPVKYNRDDAAGINRTGLDQVVLSFKTDGRSCQALDRGILRDSGNVITADNPDVEGGVTTGCRIESDGSFAIEMRKTLVRQAPDDGGDIAYDYDREVGWVGDRELGFRLEFQERGRGAKQGDPVQFAWPPNTTNVDGNLSFRRNADLADELDAYATIPLAQLGQSTLATPRWRAPALSQGSALAGVGILAMLGETRSSATLNATTFAQGFATHQGLAILADAGGDDDYEAAYLAQGAAAERGLALFLEADGDENYTATTAAAGYAVPVSGGVPGTAFFMDLNGDDRYARVISVPCPTTPESVCTRALDAPTESSIGNNAQWTQNNAIGVDYHALSTVRANVQSLTLNRLFDSEKRVNLTVYAYDETAQDEAARCSATPGTVGGKLAISGKVCLQALVNTSSITQVVNGNTFGNLTVTGVDFVLGGYRVARAQGSLVPNTTDLWRFRSVVDLGQVVDGVSTLRATATFAVDATTVGLANGLPVEGQARRGVLLFQDPLRDDPQNPGVRRVFIDNAPSAAVRASPPFVGIANASWSSGAYGANQELRVEWRVAHDAEEDLYEAYMGWAIPPAYRNVPCTTTSTELCNVLPFYLRFRPSTAADITSNQAAVIEGEFTTTPAPDASGVARIESGGQGGTRWTQRSPRLELPLEIYANNSFHLALPGRTAIYPQPSDYTTQIRLYLIDENNQTVQGSDGRPWSLAAGTTGDAGLKFTVRKEGTTDTAVRALRELPGASLGPTLDNVANRIRGAGDLLPEDNPVLGLLQLANTSICTRVVAGTTIPDTGGAFATTCMAYQGDWTITNKKLCTGRTTTGDPDPHLGSGITPAVFRGRTPMLPNLPLIGAGINNGAVQNAINQVNGVIIAANGATIVAANSQLNATHEPGTTPEFCSGPNTLRNSTEQRVAPIPDGVLGDATAGVGEAISEQACVLQPGVGDCTGSQSELNWRDFYFDVNRVPPADPDIQIQGDRVVIPAGYQIKLEFNVTDEGVLGRTPASLGLLGNAVDQVIDLAFESADEILPISVSTLDVPVPGGVSATIPAPLAGQGVCAGRTVPPCQPATVNVGDPNGGSTVEVPVKDALDSQLRGTGEAFHRADRVNPIVSFFSSDGGEPHMQPRFEIRVPTKPGTLASVRLQNENGDTVATLRGLGYAEGDVPGSPTSASLTPTYPADRPDVRHVDTTKLNQGLRFTQRVTACDGNESSGRRCTDDMGGPLPDGLYTVNVSADDNGRLGYATTSLVVDSTAPRTTIITPEYAGRALLIGGSKIPVSWITEEDGSGLNATAVWMRVGSDGEWRPVNMKTEKGEPLMFPDAIRNLSASGALRTTSVLKESSDEYWFIAVGIDRAGNVEGSTRATNLSNALKEGFQAKRDLCTDGAEPWVCRRVTVDQTRPTVSSVAIKGGRIVARDGLEFHYVRGGAPVEISVCADDARGDIGRVNLSLDFIDARNGTVRSTSTAIERDPEGCPHPTDPTRRIARFVSSDWHLTNGDKTQVPDGIWSVSFDVYDLAANRRQEHVANVVLDSVAPDVTPQPPIFPGDQSAVKPGDTVKLRLTAIDRFEVDPTISVDASKLTRSNVRTGRASDGALEATFTVDREDIKNGVETVRVTVRDLAGNERVVEFFVPVNFRSFKYIDGSLQVTNVTHNSLVLRWKTDEPTTAYVRSGTAPLQLGARTPTNATPTTDHAILVSGLQPSTRYYLKAVSASTGGYQVESDVVEATTGSALRLTVFSPKEGDSVSGTVPVRFQGVVLDSDAIVKFTLEAQPSPDKPWSFDKVAIRPGGNQTLTFNSSHFLDSSTFRLRLTAEAGKDSTSVVIGPFTSDNTQPTVTIHSPLIATNDTTPRVQAEIVDALSGLGEAPAALFIDGKQVAEALVFDRIDGGVRVTYDVPSALSPGEHVFELRAKDRAGNAATGNTWTVAIDGDAPEIVPNPTRFSPGTSAAKLGGTVTFNLTLKDASGVASVVAQTGELSAQKQLSLVKLVNTDLWTGTVSVSAAEPAATVSVLVTAVDLAGNAAQLPLEIEVDNVAPQAGAASLVSATHTKAILSLKADEPVLLSASATSGRSPPVSAATSVAAADAQIALDGLLPSRTYAYEMQVVDRAGNALTRTGEFDTLEDTVAPSGVGTLGVIDLLNGTLRLSWPAATDDVGIAYYRVYRSDDGTTFRTIAEVQGTTYDDVGLPYEKTHVYKIAAVDHGNNEGDASASLRAAATAVPRLTSGIVTPTIGTVSTPFRYVVTYLSPGGVAPAFVRVILDGVPQEMQLQSGEPATGAVYAYETKLAPHKRDDPHTYTFEASDGRYTVRFPDDGSVMRGPLVSADASAGSSGGGFASFARQVPGFEAAGLGLALGLALAVGLAVRKKKGGSQ